MWGHQWPKQRGAADNPFWTAETDHFNLKSVDSEAHISYYNTATLKLNLTIQLFFKKKSSEFLSIFFSLNVTWKCKNVKIWYVSAAPPTLRSRSAGGTLNLESPQRNVVSGCWQQKPRRDLVCREKGPERASGDWGQMCNGAITLTDRHPLPNFYAKQEKEERSVGLWEEEKAGIYLSLWLPLVRRLHQLLRGRRRWRERCICIRIHAYTNPVWGGAFNSAMAFTCWE